MAGAASQTRRWLLPGTWSHFWFAGVRGALLLVPQWQCISYFVFYFIATYIFVNDWQCIIIMIIHTYVVYDSSRTLYDLGEKGKLVASTLHRFYVLKLAHPLLYDDDTLTHAANDIKRIFLIIGSKILDRRSWSYLDIAPFPHTNATIITHRLMILPSLRQWLLADLHCFLGQNMTCKDQT